MKYPKDLEHFKSHTELLAYLFGALSNAYNMLAQYEADEVRDEGQKLRDTFDDLMKPYERSGD